MPQRLIRKVKKTRAVQTILAISRKIALPGFEGFSLYEVASLFIRGLQNGGITLRASAMAFDFFLAIFPFIIFLFTLIPYVPIEHFQESMMAILKDLMPKAAYETVESTLTEIITKQNGSLLSFGFISALYFSTNGIVTMMVAFNSSFHSVETRNALQQRLTALMLVVIITLMLFIAIGLLLFSEIALHRLIQKEHWAYYGITFGRWIILFGLFFCIISINYYLGPSKKAKWKFISAGSTLSTLLSIITSVGFAFYVNNFNQYNKLYGSIGTLLMIMFWIYLNSLVLLIGFELNASIHSAKKRKPELHTESL